MKAVLVDLGDVLIVDDITLAASTEGFRLGLEAIGRSGRVSPTRIMLWLRRAVGEGGTRREYEQDLVALARRALRELTGGEVTPDEADAFLVASHRHFHRFQRLLPDGERLLRGLRERRLPVAVVSNTPTPPPLMGSLLDDLGITPLVDSVVLSSAGHRRKPHPDMFVAAAGSLGVAPVDGVMLGDRIHEDVGGGGAVGMATVLATWARPATDESGPDCVAGSAEEALRFIDAWSAR